MLQISARFLSFVTGIPETSRYTGSLRARTAELDDPDRKRRYNRKLFSVVAPRYDVVTLLLSLGGDARWKRRLVRMLPIQVSGTLIDIATGTGDIAGMLAERYPDARVVAVDLNPGMIARARRRLRRFGRRVELMEGDMSKLPVENGTAAVVTGGYAIRNAPSVDTTVAELARVLQPGGKVALLDFARSANRAAFAVQYRLLRLWGQLWGVLLHGDPEVYGYIARSLARFPDRGAFHELLASHSLRVVRTERFYFGMLESVLAVKEPGER